MVSHPTQQNSHDLLSQPQLINSTGELCSWNSLSLGSGATLSLHPLIGRMAHKLSYRFTTEGLTQMIEKKRKENAAEITYSRGHSLTPWREFLYFVLALHKDEMHQLLGSLSPFVAARPAHCFLLLPKKDGFSQAFCTSSIFSN